MFFFFVAEQPDPGVNQNRAEDIEHPVELADNDSAGEDETSAENYSAEDPPKQHPVMVFFFDIEKTKDQQDHKQIIYRQHLFRDIGAEKLGPGFRPHETPNQKSIGR